MPEPSTAHPSRYQPWHGIRFLPRIVRGRDFTRVSRPASTVPGELGQNQPEPVVVAPVVRVVVVAIRGTAVPGVVVPAAAA